MNTPPAPATVDIGAISYELISDAEMIVAHAAYMGSNCQGFSSSRAQRIVYAPDLGPDMARAVVLHEIGHQLLEQAGLRFEDESRKDDPEEAICDVIGFGFLAVLRNNPQLARWLLG